MKYQIFSESLKIMFLSCLLSSISLYGIATIVACQSLKARKFGRCCAVFIFAHGIIIPITLGLITSACVAFVYTASNIDMSLCEAFLWGAGHTIAHTIFVYTRVVTIL